MSLWFVHPESTRERERERGGGGRGTNIKSCSYDLIIVDFINFIMKLIDKPFF